MVAVHLSIILLLEKYALEEEGCMSITVTVRRPVDGEKIWQEYQGKVQEENKRKGVEAIKDLMSSLNNSRTLEEKCRQDIAIASSIIPNCIATVIAYLSSSVKEVIKQGEFIGAFDSIDIENFNVSNETSISTVDSGSSAIDNGLIDQEIESLLNTILKENRSLTALSLNNFGINDQHCKTLAQAVSSNNSIIALSLCDNAITDLGGKMLAEMLARNSSLEIVSLNNNLFSSEIGNIFAKVISDNRSLKILSLSKSKIDGKGALALAEALKTNKTLIALSLGKNIIGNQESKALAEMLKINQTLQALNLNSNNIGDEGGLAFIEAGKTNNSLKEIIITQNHINSEIEKDLYDIYARIDEPSENPVRSALSEIWNRSQNIYTNLALLRKNRIQIILSQIIKSSLTGDLNTTFGETQEIDLKERLQQLSLNTVNPYNIIREGEYDTKLNSIFDSFIRGGFFSSLAIKTQHEEEKTNRLFAVDPFTGKVLHELAQLCFSRNWTYFYVDVRNADEIVSKYCDGFKFTRHYFRDENREIPGTKQKIESATYYSLNSDEKTPQLYATLKEMEDKDLSKRLFSFIEANDPEAEMKARGFSQAHIGDCYERGEFVGNSKDPVESTEMAKCWYLRAAEACDRTGVMSLARLETADIKKRQEYLTTAIHYGKADLDEYAAKLRHIREGQRLSSLDQAEQDLLKEEEGKMQEEIVAVCQDIIACLKERHSHAQTDEGLLREEIQKIEMQRRRLLERNTANPTSTSTAGNVAVSSAAAAASTT